MPSHHHVDQPARNHDQLFDGFVSFEFLDTVVLQGQLFQFLLGDIGRNYGLGPNLAVDLEDDHDLIGLGGLGIIAGPGLFQKKAPTPQHSVQFVGDMGNHGRQKQK